MIQITANKELKVALTANKVAFDGLNSKIDKIVRLLRFDSS